jgi:hypothetical protein
LSDCDFLKYCSVGDFPFLMFFQQGVIDEMCSFAALSGPVLIPLNTNSGVSEYLVSDWHIISLELNMVWTAEPPVQN